MDYMTFHINIVIRKRYLNTLEEIAKQEAGED